MALIIIQFNSNLLKGNTMSDYTLEELVEMTDERRTANKIKFAETFVKLSDIVNFDRRCYPIHISLAEVLEHDPNNSFLIEDVYETMDCKIAEMEAEIADMKALRKEALKLAKSIHFS